MARVGPAALIRSPRPIKRVCLSVQTQRVLIILQTITTSDRDSSLKIWQEPMTSGLCDLQGLPFHTQLLLPTSQLPASGYL